MNINHQYKHVIWDWNGTLLDDTLLCIEIMNSMLLKRNMPLMNIDLYKKIFGFPIKDYYRKVGFDFSIESFENLAHEYLDEYDSRCTECALHDGATGMLRQIKSTGITQSILSASNIQNLIPLLENFKIQNYFTHINGLGNNFAESKTDLGKKWLSGQKLNAAEVVMIGDTEHDYETAQAMEIECILISHGHQSIERLEKCNVMIFESIKDLKQLFV